MMYKHFSESELEILKQRARRIERAARADTNEGLREALLVNIERETYAIPVDSIRAVYRDLPITALPQTPERVAGIVNLRGRIATVMNLGIILGVDSEVDPNRNTVVVTSNGDYEVGLAVDYSNHMVAVNVADLNAVNTMIELTKDEYVAGVLADGTVLLDVEAILNDSDFLVNQEER